MTASTIFVHSNLLVLESRSLDISAVNKNTSESSGRNTNENLSATNANINTDANARGNIRGEELAFFVTAATNILAQNLTADEMNVVGNALTLAGQALMTIASVASAGQITK